MYAEEIIKSCGDWKNQPETDEERARRERIAKKIIEKMKKEGRI